MDFYKVRGLLGSWKLSGPSSLSAAGGLRDWQIDSIPGQLKAISLRARLIPYGRDALFEDTRDLLRV
jgi:hypothetical protein